MRLLFGSLLACVALACALSPFLSSAEGEGAAPAEASSAHGATGGAPRIDGEALYNRFCLQCHGLRGDGHGPARSYVWPRPRDFTSGTFKWKSTPPGQAPTDEDLANTIRHGVWGTSMHSFSASFNDRHIAALIDKIKGFAPKAFASQPARSPTPSPPSVEAGQVALGRKLYRKLECTGCHGEAGGGDGPRSARLKNADGLPAELSDWRTSPLRRPRGRDEDRRRGIYLTLRFGVDGTPMKSFAESAGDDALWALSAYVDSLAAPRPATAPPNKHSDLHPQAIARDGQGQRSRAGYWTAHGLADEDGLFGKDISPQGPVPEVMAPAQSTASAQQCARCHNKQWSEWQDSFHAKAGSPGLLAQLVAMESRGKGASAASCQRCHSPLAEQQALTRAHRAAGYERNPLFDRQLRQEGINCATCHMRGFRRFGPPNPSPSLLRMPNYPVRDSDTLYTQLEIYERADFCMPCHQLPARLAKDGRPLLNTYKEWLEGPYMRRGIQCQHCHMPNREHRWKGIHDPDTFRQGVELEVLAGRTESGTVTVRARLRNVGAGHYLPTTPTPAAWLGIELVDAKGDSIAGAQDEMRIGRHLEYRDGWRELEDTRIPPGESVELARAWKLGRTGEATHARVTVRVHPDDYYEGFYSRRLRQASLTPEQRSLFRRALRSGRQSHYLAIDRLVPIREHGLRAPAQ